MSVHYRINNGEIHIFGQTFAVKEHLKTLGARFNFTDKTWSLTDTIDNRGQIQAFCQSLGGSNLSDAVSNGSKETLSTDEKKLLKPQPLVVESVNLHPVASGLSLRDLVTQIQMSLTKGFPNPIWIYGEISSISQRASGIFISLSEAKDAKKNAAIEIKTIIWHSQFATISKRRDPGALKEILREGMKVRVLAQVTMFQDRGNITLNVLDIDPAFSKGVLALEREKTIHELKKLGLYNANHLVASPQFCLRVGLVTADGSRAQSDFIDQLQSGGYAGTVFFAHAQVQGQKVCTEIPSAITKLNNYKVDLIVITRGGGSAGDLRWFDNKQVAKAICMAKTPILAAIGHHEDRSIAEEVAAIRQKTPTAAAEWILNQQRTTLEAIDQLAFKLSEQTEEILDAHGQQWNWLNQNFALMGVKLLDKHDALIEQSLSKIKSISELLINKSGQRILRLSDQINSIVTNHIKIQQSKILHKFEKIEFSSRNFLNSLLQNTGVLENQLTRFDPSEWLKKGWTKLSQDSKPISSIHDIDNKSPIVARFIDGRAEFNLTSKTTFPQKRK